MAQPSTPAAGNSTNTYGSSSFSSITHSNLHGGPVLTPNSTTSSNNTFLMPNSPIKDNQGTDNYRPKVIRSLGLKPACLVNASVTYCGSNAIYAFGGFDAYTDEVYNHVLKLDMISHQWALGSSYTLPCPFDPLLHLMS
jgi:hypothetical protein